MVGVLGGRLDQLRHDVRRSRFVGISHPEIDYVLTGAPRLQAQFSDRVEDVGRQPFDSWEIHFVLALGDDKRPPNREL